MSDPAQRTDGLAMLQGRRAKRTRSIPPSQNPTSLPPYEAPTPVVDLNAEEAQEEAPKPAPAPKSPKAAPAAASDPAPVKPASRKVGLYLNEAHENFTFAVQAAGKRTAPAGQPHRLSSGAPGDGSTDGDMSVEQVRDTIVAKPVDPSAPGRRRR